MGNRDAARGESQATLFIGCLSNWTGALKQFDVRSRLQVLSLLASEKKNPAKKPAIPVRLEVRRSDLIPVWYQDVATSVSRSLA